MTRLGAIVGDPAETSHAFRLYTEIVTAPLPVTVEVARKAIQLRELAGSRLPLVDSLIAAAANVENATLVHRDAHFDGIPGSQLRQLTLGPRASRSRGESKRPGVRS
jgi:predicted nucleic acid-binding protein